MNCLCDLPARYLVSRDGKPCFTCAGGRCRLFAFAPVQCDGYTRVTLGAPGSPPADVGVVLRFEALLHPTNKDEACFMIRVQGDPARWASLRLSVLQDPQYEGMWYTSAKTFLYPMAQYAPLLAALKARPQPFTAVEEIPSFYTRCVERMRQLPRQYAEEVAAGRARLPDPDDCVFRRLKPFQKDGVRFVLAHHGRAMIADDMGLGKTVQAIAVAHHYRDEWPVLVVCPMSLVENWAKEFNKFCGIPFARIAILQGAKATATSLQDVIIVSYSSLKCVEQARFNVVILDESHYIKAGAAKRAQQSLKLCRESRRALLLSGTPAMSRPIELYAQLQAIQPSIVPSKTQFGARYCNAYVSRFGIDLTGHSHADELHSLLQHYLIRRTKRELGSVLPSKSRQLLYVYITDKEKKALEKQIIALRRSLTSVTASAASPSACAGSAALFDAMGSGGDWSARAPNAFEMKMATARAKIPAVQDYVSSVVEQHLDSGEKVILFAHHQCMMEALRSAVEAVRPRQPIDYIYISGDTPPAQREPAAEHFRTEPMCTVAILSMQSSGTGHNFTCASTVVFTELDWNPSTHLQCEDRVHRIGQAQACHIKYLLAEGTSDSVIWPLLQAKLSVTTAMFETSSAAGAEVHLHDGADKQNVVRRDVVVATASSSTPSGSQQSTLDRFVQPHPSPSASNAGAAAVVAGEEEVMDGVVVSLRPSPRATVTSPSPPVLGSADREGPPLLLTPTAVATTPTATPTALSQHTPRAGLSLLGSPLSAPRGGAAGTTAMSTANSGAPPTVPLTTSRSPFTPPPVVPFSEMGDAFAAPLTGSSVAAAAAPRRPRPSTGGGGGGSVTATEHVAAGGIAPPATQQPATSVLDMMRQTGAARSAHPTPAVTVVDLTDGGANPPPPTTSRAPPPSATLVTASAPAPAAPRRTVFTFSKTSGAAAPTPAATVTPLADVAGPPPPPTAVPVVQPAAAPTPPAITPPPLPARDSIPGSSGSSGAAAVHVPLRTNLHLKRPRGEAERGPARVGIISGGGSAWVAPYHAAAPAMPGVTSVHAKAPPTPASTALPRTPPAMPLPEMPVMVHPAMLAASAAASPAVSGPRRTLFRLVSGNNAGASPSAAPGKPA